MVTSDLRAKVEIWSFRARAMHPAIIISGIKHGDFCCFKGVTYVALTVCFKLRSFFALIT